MGEGWGLASSGEEHLAPAEELPLPLLPKARKWEAGGSPLLPPLPC